VEADPGEHDDLALHPTPETAAKLVELQSLLDELNGHIFEPGRGTEVVQACEVQGSIGGFFGPFVNATDFYTPVHMTPAEEKANEELMKELKQLNEGILMGKTFEEIMKIVPADVLMRNLDECRDSNTETLVI